MRLADLGVGNGLMNAIAGALAIERRDLVRAHISTAFMLLSTIAAGLGVICVLVWPWLDWVALFGITGPVGRAEAAPAVAASITVFLLSFPLSVVNVTYNATQQGKIANYWGMAGNVLSLVTLFVVTHTHGGLNLLVIAVSGMNLLVSMASGIWLFTHRSHGIGPRLQAVQRSTVSGLLKVGIPFFLIQIISLIVFQSDNLIIAHFLGAAQVPAYSLTYNLFNYTTLIQTVGFSYVWVAYADAIARHDIDWVRRTLRFNLIFSVGTTTVIVAPLIFIAQPFIHFWTKGAVTPPLVLVLWISAWSIINAFCSPIACILAAASHMKAQVIYSAIAAVTNIALSIYLVKIWGAPGVIAATVFSYLVFICGPASIDTFLLLKKLRHAV